MAKQRRYTSEQIILKLREADVLLARKKRSRKYVDSWKYTSRLITGGDGNMGE